MGVRNLSLLAKVRDFVGPIGSRSETALAGLGVLEDYAGCLVRDDYGDRESRQSRTRRTGRTNLTTKICTCTSTRDINLMYAANCWSVAASGALRLTVVGRYCPALGFRWQERHTASARCRNARARSR